MSRLTQEGTPRARLARAPVMPHINYQPIVENHVTLDFMHVQGHSRIVLIDADGPRSYGALDAHTPTAVRELDLWLDSLDACHEDPDGRLPGLAA